MMRLIIALLTFLILTAFPVRAEENILVLSYHHIMDENPDQARVSITTASLIEQLDWLKGNGYTSISAQDLLDASAGIKALPPKPVYLTFDDGYESFYSRAYPLLKAYNMHAALALVGKWLEVPEGDMVSYGDDKLPRSEFLSWTQVKEIAASGLVDIASHTYDLHKGEMANPQGNTQPAVPTHIYNQIDKSYETPEAHFKRIQQDLAQNNALIRKKAGVSPLVMVWPYGEYSSETLAIAVAEGMPITLSLDVGFNGLDDIANLNRILIAGDMTLNSFVQTIRKIETKPPQRAIQVDLDYVYDEDPAQQDQNLGLLLNRIQRFAITTVYLQAFVDNDGDAVAEALYYPNRFLPMKADLFNRVAWQLRTRADVKVYAWMPLIAFKTDDESLLIKQQDRHAGEITINPDSPRRLSPFNPEAAKLLTGVFEDLGRYASFSGIHFSDDGVMSDYEDVSPYGLAAFGEYVEQPVTFQTIQQNPELAAKWVDFKEQALINLSHEQIKAAEIGGRKLETSRNLFARTIQQPESRTWFAQDLPSSLRAYDYTPIMAMPFLENVADEDWQNWLLQLVENVKAQDNGVEKSVFQIQMVDWRNPRTPLSQQFIKEQITLLLNAGVKHMAYYPDDFITNHPPADLIEAEFSLRTYPFIPK